jgi:hypothetical protein
MATLVANRSGHRDFAFFAIRAHICVEKYFHVFTKGGTAFTAGSVVKLEIPYFPAPWTTIMWDDLNFTIGNVLLG